MESPAVKINIGNHIAEYRFNPKPQIKEGSCKKHAFKVLHFLALKLSSKDHNEGIIFSKDALSFKVVTI